MSRQWVSFAFAAASCLIAAWPAQASLGGGRESIDADSRHFSARASATAASTHTVHVLTMPNGEVIREFARADGKVFAVSWRGPARPDLRQLLGPRFDTVQADNVLPGGRRTRRPLAVGRPDFAMSSGGHPGAFWGVAYLPALAPPGFPVKALVEPAA
jgi:hypothetical protein